jgi:hypothetical protein
MDPQSLDVLAMLHLVMLSLWGGVVATEAVIEVYPFRRRDLHSATIRLHYWIDLLVELPIVLAVVISGVLLAVTIDTVTPLHVVKIVCGGAAVAVNLFCIVVVIRRGRKLERHPDDGPLWRLSKTVLVCFAAGLLCASGAAVLGFRFALERISVPLVELHRDQSVVVVVARLFPFPGVAEPVRGIDLPVLSDGVEKRAVGALHTEAVASADPEIDVGFDVHSLRGRPKVQVLRIGPRLEHFRGVRLDQPRETQ